VAFLLELIMRKVLFAAIVLASALTGLWSPARADIIAAPLTWTSESVSQILGFPVSCPNCTSVSVSPVFQFAPGDTVDFGTLVLGSFYGGASAPVPPYIIFRWDPMFLAGGPFLPSSLAAMAQAPGPGCDSSVSGNTCLSAPLPDPKTFQLEYTTPDGGQIQFAFTGQVISYTPAVPEPSTWAMMLIGFACVGMAYRRKSKPASMAV
jgi:hypothetical protein